MQILGKRSKVLLIAVAIAMLVAIGVSFAAWDISAVKASNGDLSSYANAQVGEKITFGKYYQDGTKTGDKYDKQPITWIVVDKDERTGQLTLLSEKILAAGSYFGNSFYNSKNKWGAHYDNNTTIADIPHNAAYVESTARAYLNNLERFDLGGDEFTSGIGYVPSVKNSTTDTGLLSSIGFSNQRYWTNLSYATEDDKKLVDTGNKGLIKRIDNDEIYYQRPINNSEYLNRPATLGFLDEAFDNKEKSMIVPKQIAGYIGHRWPDNAHDITAKSYVEGTIDKVWLPSATELNVMNGQDWANQTSDEWTNPSDEASSTVFEYFKNYENYGFASVSEAVKATRTEFAKNSFAMNYSIPVYNKETATINTDIHTTDNSTDHYWTRSPSSYWYYYARVVSNSGTFTRNFTHYSFVGVRPCVILKY